MLQNSLVHILHSTHGAHLPPFFFSSLFWSSFGCLLQVSGVQARQGKKSTLTLCPFIPGSPGVPGNPRAPCNKKKKRNITQKYSYLQFRCLPVSVCVSVSLFRRKSLTCGPGVPLSPGLPGLPLLPCESAKQTLPFDILAARNSATQICYKAAGKKTKPLKSACRNTNVYVRPLQLCQRLQRGHEDQRGPWERKAEHLRSQRLEMIMADNEVIPKQSYYHMIIWSIVTILEDNLTVCPGSPGSPGCPVCPWAPCWIARGTGSGYGHEELVKFDQITP